MSRDVFISYSRKNMAQVMEIKNQIDRTCGTECWIDLKGIESGSEMFLRDIVGGIDACKVFLFMLSRESMESEYALLELNYAKEQGKRVVLVNIDDCRMNGVFLFKYSLTDTIVWNNPPQREKLLRDVARWVGVTQSKNRQESNNLKVIEERIAQLDKEMGKLIKVRDSNGKIGFKNDKGILVIPYKWKECDIFFNEGLMAVKDDNNKWGFIDKGGNMIIPCNWNNPWARPFSEGLAAVRDINGKWGYIDKSGKIVITCQWNNVGGFYDSLSSVRNQDGKVGYIDKQGNVVIKCQWKDADRFSELMNYKGYATVKDFSNKYWLIDKQGVIVREFKEWNK